ARTHGAQLVDERGEGPGVLVDRGVVGERERGLAVDGRGADLGMEAEERLAEDDVLAGVSAVIERLPLPGEEAVAQRADHRAGDQEEAVFVREREQTTAGGV